MHIVHSTDIGDCPAAVDRTRGILYINPEVMESITPFQRKFVVLHELGHYRLDTSDEVKADAYAFDRLAGTEWRSLKQCLESLSEVLDGDNPTLRPRYEALYRRALEWDAARGNAQAAAALGQMDYASGNRLDSAADFIYTTTEADALMAQTQYAGESLLLQNRNMALLYIIVGLVLVLWLL